MPRRCAICTHPDRDAIDEALVGGVAFPALVAKHRVSKDSLSRHKGNHLPAKLVMARAAEEVAEADSLLDQVRGLQRRALGILDKAEAAGDLRTALGAIREARGTSSCWQSSWASSTSAPSSTSTSPGVVGA